MVATSREMEGLVPKRALSGAAILLPRAIDDNRFFMGAIGWFPLPEIVLKKTPESARINFLTHCFLNTFFRFFFPVDKPGAGGVNSELRETFATRACARRSVKSNPFL
jgi:hypothetical protein